MMSKRKPKLPSLNYMHKSWHFCHCDIDFTLLLLITAVLHTGNALENDYSRDDIRLPFAQFYSFLIIHCSRRASPCDMSSTALTTDKSRNGTALNQTLHYPSLDVFLAFLSNAMSAFFIGKEKILPPSRSCHSAKQQGAATGTSCWGHHHRFQFFCQHPSWLTMCWIIIRHPFGILGL